jgi:riboflavin biosynthesis pyrimidine reductase
MWAHRFDAFARRKERQAREAAIEGFVTVDDRSAAFDVRSLGTPWTYERFDGWFHWTAGPGGRSMNLVFVQSADGNTVANDPASLGGGDTDKHLIYEGLSRVHADAVLAGARTVRGSQMVFSVWHPEMIRMRAGLGRPRHPVQVVVSGESVVRFDDELMFNVPDVAVVVITSDAGAAIYRAAARSRPWVEIVATGPSIDLPSAVHRLSATRGIHVISAVGGRTTATALVNAGLISDLYLTTSPRTGGVPGTPLYARGALDTQAVVRKRGRGRDAGVRFEHLRLRAVSGRAPAPEQS